MIELTAKKTYKEIETLEKRGKKKYQQRLIQEKEAEDMLREIDYEYDEEYDLPKLKLDKDGV
jgi:hypothetical protein